MRSSTRCFRHTDWYSRGSEPREGVRAIGRGDSKRKHDMLVSLNAIAITPAHFLTPLRAPTNTTSRPSEATDCYHGCNNRRAGFNRHASRALRNGSSGNCSYRSTIDSEQVTICSSRPSSGSADCERSGEQLERRHQPLTRMSGGGTKGKGDLHGAGESHVCMCSLGCADRECFSCSRTAEDSMTT